MEKQNKTRLSFSLRSLVSIFIAHVMISVSSFAQVANEIPPKVVILYSSIGMGHLSAARAIEQNIKERDPRSIVILKNIRDFMNPKKAEIDEKLYWYLVKNHTETFDKMFRKAMAKGNAVDSLAELKSSYDSEKLYTFLTNQNPTAIIATHYGSAQTIGNLRLAGKLRHIPVGWLHTDYFTGYFPRISQNVEKTFVGMPQMRETWVEKGVDPSKVVSTGMPVNPALFAPVDRDAFLKSQGLDPKIPTIVLASGGEGVGNFPLIVEKVAAAVGGKLQIVAVCAKNEKHFEALTKMQPNLRKDLKLVITKMIPNGDLLSYIKSSDLFITKSGGLSPTEAFAITKPTVLLDVYGAHERDNADLFEKEGYAVVNRDQSKIGEDVLKVLQNKDLQAKMVAKQLEFRNSFNLGAITEFAFNPRENMSPFRLGVENGETVSNGRETLAKLEKDSPADIEVILSYGKSQEGKYFTGDSNPFGHLAVRIGETVYTANGRAQRGVEPRLMHQTSLFEYLYGVDRPYQNVEHTDAFGSSFGRDNISLRVKGATPESIRRMQDEISRIEAEWQEGKIEWNAKAFNCADFVARILKAGGFDPRSSIPMGELNKKKGQITMPLDVFDAFRVHFENVRAFRTEMIHYSSVPGSENVYKTTRFPLSIKQIKRSLLNAVLKRVDPAELEVGKRIAFDINEGVKAIYDNKNGTSVAKNEAETTAHEQKQEKLFEEISVAEKNVEKMKQNIDAGNLSSRSVLNSINNSFKTFSESELSAIMRSNPAEIQDVDKRAKAIALIEKIQKWDAANTRLQAEKDVMIQKELDFFINGTRFALNQTFDALKASGNTAKIAAFKDLAEKAEVHYQNYVKNRNQYGQPKDGPLRTLPYREFFITAKTYFDALKTEPAAQNEPSLKFWAKLSQKSKSLYKVLAVLTKIAPATLKAMLHVWFSPEAPAGKAPVVESMGEAIRKLAKELGIVVNIKDKAKLPTPSTFDGKNINIIAPTHRDPFFDTVVMFQMNLDKSLVVMATDQIIENPKMANRVDKVDSVITVGRGSNLPIEKIKQQLAKNKTNTIIIYPEGSVSTGFSETRPLREKFSTGLLTQLREAGYNVNVIPVTYENTSRFVFESSLGTLFSKLDAKESVRLDAQVHDSIDARTMELLNKVTGSDTVMNRMIRSIWLEQLSTDKEHLMGALRADKIMKQMNKDLGIDLSVKPGAAPRMNCPLLIRSIQL